MIKPAAPGQPGSPMTKDLAAKVRQQDREVRRRNDRVQREHREMAQRAKDNGYDANRPNHFMHDSLGDPATCQKNHNHPHHIGE